MTITYSVVYVIDGEARTVVVADNVQTVPFTLDPFAVFDPVGGALYPADWTVLGEDKR
jgi:hypothetical protein